MASERKIAAVVLAGGLSSRAPGFKPLLPLGGGTVISAVLDLFREAGVDDIIVVTGYRSSGLTPLLDRLGARPVLNERYEEGMFSSVVAGVQALYADTDAFFLLPADMPLVRCSTLSALSKAYARGKPDVVYPVFRKERGHPPLISGRCIRDILAGNRPEGLRTLLQEHEARSQDVPVMDEGILLDIDTAEDYGVVAARFGRRMLPSPAERDAILAVAEASEQVIRHCRIVADTARAIAEALNRAGMQLDVDLITCAGLLHDLAKGKPHHALTGARMLITMGFPEVADIVAAHHAPGSEKGLVIDAASVLFLADKLVIEDRIVSLDERFRTSLNRYAGDEAVLSRVRQRFHYARLVQNAVEQATGTALDLLVRKETQSRQETAV